MTRHFTLDEARSLLAAVQQKVRELQPVRADLAELAAALQENRPSRLGALPELKALEARMHELLEWFSAEGIQVKGMAPVLVDFPAMAAGREVLLCWLEGETELGWYHDPALGFLGRRPLDDLDWG